MAAPSIAPELTLPSRGARARGFRPRLGDEIHRRAPGELGWRIAPSTDSQQPRCRPHQRSCRARDVPSEENSDELPEGATTEARVLPEGANCQKARPAKRRDLPNNATCRTTRADEQREPTNGAECGARRNSIGFTDSRHSFALTRSPFRPFALYSRWRAFPFGSTRPSAVRSRISA